MTTELVSIVLTTLNAERYLREAIESCLGQTHGNIELIVVDGGSTDDTLAIVSSYSDPRLRIILQEGNAGKLPGAINLGLDHATGDYLTWMQADCLYALTAIERMVNILQENPNIGQAYTDFYETDEDGHVVKTVKTREPEEFLRVMGDPAGVCFLIRRDVRDQVGPHDVTTHPNHDYDYRMRIALRYPSHHIPEPLYYWRYHSESLTGRVGWVALARKDIEIRVKLGLDTSQQARRRRAEIDIPEAFEYFETGLYERVPRLICSGLLRNPKFAANLGVWSILGRSLWRRYVRRSNAAH